MLKKKRGIAIIEFVFFFFVFVFFFALMYGSWGIAHSSILHSIGARAYAWEVIRGRSNLAFLRDSGNSSDILGNNYWLKNSRVFAIIKGDPPEDFVSDKLKIDMGGADWKDETVSGFTGVDVSVSERRAGYYDSSSSITSFTDSNDPLALGKRNEQTDYKTGVVHLRIAYGICLNSDCDAP